MDCIFCKIVNKEINSEIVFENENIIGFNDINPVAPYHVLFVPKKHIDKISNVESSDINLLGELIFQAKEYAKKLGIDESGFRLVLNTGKNAGQAVFHIHLHLIGGRMMSWPPG
ncbi:MAG: histidine triad nucleotide-binding protein [Ignavibacteria bacterium]|nr:histidine triad nucleotide-binding protein [Ignavibacteria bacterium]MDH7527560.1 histidine triad nucleotide-binding protein [Ignavibacteria bacterium]